MSANKIYTNLVEQFKIDVENATRDALDKIHSEMVPYLNDDTDSNAIYRAVEIVQKILIGNFEVEDGKIKVDGWTICRLTDFDYDKLVDILSAKAGDAAKDKKIERLERNIKDYEQARWGLHTPSN
jgi:hypothetical protein